MSSGRTGRHVTSTEEREKMGEDLAEIFDTMCKKEGISQEERIQIAYCAFYAMQKKARGVGQ